MKRAKLVKRMKNAAKVAALLADMQNHTNIELTTLTGVKGFLTACESAMDAHMTPPPSGAESGE
jgi:hypothetical protein